MMVRWNRLYVIVLAMLTYSSLPAQQKTEPQVGSLERSAGSFVSLLDKKEYVKAANAFDAAMLKALPASELKQTWEKVLFQAGPYKKQISSRRETLDKFESVYVTCEFAKMKLDVQVVFDKEGKIAGLFFKPAKQPTPSGIEEIWEGAIEVNGVKFPLVFHTFKQKDGRYAGTMDSPDQGSTGNLLDVVIIKGDKIQLELKSAMMVFEGKLNKDGTEILGNFKQLEQSFPLTLKKVAHVK